MITHASYMIFNVSYKSNQYSKHKLFPVLNCGTVNKKFRLEKQHIFKSLSYNMTWKITSFIWTTIEVFQAQQN